MRFEIWVRATRAGKIFVDYYQEEEALKVLRLGVPTAATALVSFYIVFDSPCSTIGILQRTSRRKPEASSTKAIEQQTEQGIPSTSAKNEETYIKRTPRLKNKRLSVITPLIGVHFT